MEKIKALLVESTGPHWTEAILFMAGGVFVAIIASGIIQLVIKHITSKTKTVIDDIIAEHIHIPAVIVVMLSGVAIGLSKLNFSETAEYRKDKIFFALFVCIACWTLMKILDDIIAQYAPPSDDHPDTKTIITPGGESRRIVQTDFKPVLRRLVNIILSVLPAAIIAKSLGYDISAVIATIGIGGAALALAARDILSSYFGSIAILVDKPFHVGDRIRFLDKNYENIDGFVTEIRFRTTRIRTLDNRIVTVPNTVFGAIPIQNVSEEPHTRVMQTVNIRVSNGYEKLKTAVRILKNLSPEGARFGSPNIASLSSVGIGIYKITFLFFIEKDADYFGTINTVNLEIAKRFEEAGIEL